MSSSATIDIPLLKRVADMLIERRQTLAVSESSTGGLISAAGPHKVDRVIGTGSTDRMENMVQFANAALLPLEQALAGP